MNPALRARPMIATACAMALALSTRSADGTEWPRAGRLSAWTTHSLEKVRPDAPLRPRSAVALRAARNEFEAFQIVIRAEGGALAGVDVEASDLVATRGRHRIASRHVAISLESYLDLALPSSLEGGAGEWPDPLLPRIDSYVGEERATFPFAVAAGRNQPLWIEVYVPRDTPPGNYRGAIDVSRHGRTVLSLPWTLSVWPFTLPSTSSFRTSFGFSGLSAVRRHFGDPASGRREVSGERLRALTRLYVSALLRHRLSSHGGTMEAPPFEWRAGAANIDWRSYDDEVAPLLDGTIFGADVPLAGARTTSIDVRTPAHLSELQKVLYWREWARHFRSRGWLDRLFVYLWDEPAPFEYGEVLRLGRLGRAADRSLAMLLTEPLAGELAGVVDVWVPLVNCFEPSGLATCGGVPVKRRSYEPLERRGGRLWWYQSCASHGCNVIGGESHRGWPRYVIDAPAVAHRILPWLAFRYGIEGELYFNTVEAYESGPDPWVDVRRHGGNGDGTLVYPGVPSRIGGVSHVPIESVRLKMIRDGLEDYEYLNLLASAGAANEAQRWASSLAPRVDRWQRRPEALRAARTAIGDELARRIVGGG